MALSLSHPGAKQKIGPSKLVLGFLVAATTALVGFSGAANAATDKPSKEWCDHHNFKNFGQCVKEWAHNRGGGYGGYGSQTNVTANTNLNLTVNGNNNVINVVIRYVFGGA